MQVEIGPVPSSAANAWLDYAEGIVRELDAVDAKGVPAEARAEFARLIREWRAAAAADPTFRWRGNPASDQVEYLILALYRLGNRLSDEEHAGQRTVRPPEARRFHVVLVQSVLDALEQQGSAQAQFVAQLREQWEPARRDT